MSLDKLLNLFEILREQLYLICTKGLEHNSCKKEIFFYLLNSVFFLVKKNMYRHRISKKIPKAVAARPKHVFFNTQWQYGSPKQDLSNLLPS